jgi:hypothetical protein
LEGVDPNTQVAKIAHTVGESKRVLIVEEAKKRSVRILNPGLKKAPEAPAALEPEPVETPTEETASEAAQEPEAKTTEPVTSKKRKKRSAK